MVGGVDDDGEQIPGPDSDHIKLLIEDAIVLLGVTLTVVLTAGAKDGLPSS